MPKRKTKTKAPKIKEKYLNTYEDIPLVEDGGLEAYWCGSYKEIRVIRRVSVGIDSVVATYDPNINNKFFSRVSIHANTLSDAERIVKLLKRACNKVLEKYS